MKLVGFALVGFSMLIAGCAGGATSGPPPQQTDSVAPTATAAPTGEFAIAGTLWTEPKPAVSNSSPNPVEPAAVYAWWTDKGLVVGASGSSGCPNVPFKVTATADQRLRVETVLATVVSPTTAKAVGPGQACTMDYGPTSFLLSEPPIARNKSLMITYSMRSSTQDKPRERTVTIAAGSATN